MHFTSIISILAVLATRVTASPMPEADNDALEERQGTASGCAYYASPRCCVPTVCRCRDGAIYQINRDAQNSGGHGCDPPWGYISSAPSTFPGHCC